MIRAGIGAALALIVALPAFGAERQTTTDVVKTSKNVELELSRWRHRPDPKSDLVTADALVRNRPADEAANRLDASSFDLLMIRREWGDPAARGWRR